jgi:hypothetical protein
MFVPLNQSRLFRRSAGEGIGHSLLATYPHRRTLHEDEALQIRRKGGVAPLARLDVDGLEGD